MYEGSVDKCLNIWSMVFFFFLFFFPFELEIVGGRYIKIFYTLWDFLYVRKKPSYIFIYCSCVCVAYVRSYIYIKYKKKRQWELTKGTIAEYAIFIRSLSYAINRSFFLRKLFSNFPTDALFIIVRRLYLYPNYL